MKPVLLAAAIALIAGQAHALSCMRPDPIETFQRLAEAPESYYVLYGELRFDEDALPTDVGRDQTRAPDPIDARFVGKALSRDGFTIDYVSNVTLQIECAGPWCGSARAGVDAVYFVPASDPPVTVIAGPCGGMIFEQPDARVLEMLTTCMQGGACSAQPFK